MRNKLAALMAKKEKLVIPADKTRTGEVFELEIKGLSFKDLTKLAGMSEKNQTEGAVNYILFSTFRKAIPNETKDKENGLSDEALQELVDELDGSIAAEVMKKVTEMSGLEAKIPKKDLEVVEKNKQ